MYLYLFIQLLIKLLISSSDRKDESLAYMKTRQNRNSFSERERAEQERQIHKHRLITGLKIFFVIAFLFLFFVSSASAQAVYEIDGSAFATKDAMVPEYIKSRGEKVILVDPRRHAWGAYSAKGKLIRWGIATTGANWCSDIQKSCRTTKGNFRIYSLGQENCISSKYPVAVGGAPMPYCMYFNGGQAIHGANNVSMANKSHGCVRIYEEDAKWLRYQFVEAPGKRNNFKGTLVIVRRY